MLGELWGWTGLLLGLLSLGADLPQDWWGVASYTAAILWLEGFAVELGGTARLLPVRAVYLAAALHPSVGPAFASLMCLSECAWRHRRMFLAFLIDRLGLLAALFLAFLLQKSGFPQAYAMVCVPLLSAWLTVEGPARQRQQLSAEERVRWALARLHTRKLDYGLALAAPALALLEPPLLLLLAPLLASTRLAGQILVLQAQKDEAGQVYQALSRIQSQARATSDQLQRAQRDKKLLEGFAAHLSGAPSLSDSAQALVNTVLELTAADDVALFLVSGENRLEPFFYRVQPEHQSLLQGSLLTGLREPLVDQAWESQQFQKRLGSQGAQLFQRNEVALALPLEQWGVLYLGRLRSLPFTPPELESLHWLKEKACLTLAVSLRQQQSRQLQQGQRRAIAGLQRQLQISAWLMESARRLGGALLVTEVVKQFAEVLGSTIPHQQRFLLLSAAGHCQFLSLPEAAAGPAARQILQEIAGLEQPLLVEELSARQAAAFPGMKSLVGVSLLGGAVALTSAQSFTRDHSEVLFLMASQMSMALARAEAHEQVLESRRQLEASQAQLIQSSKLSAIGQLAAGIAHELNTPLGAVGLSLSAARENFQSRPERALQMFERAREGLDRALSIIEKLLVYSRRPSQEFLPIDLGTLVEDTLAFLKSSEVRVELELVQGLKVLGKPQDLQQVLVHLLINAQQAVAEQPQQRKLVAIRGWREGSSVLLEVEDRGEGIAPADLPRIFEPFFTTRPVGQGTGLGLSIAHQIVDLHQGKLEVFSRLGEGTRFLLSLPGRI